MAKQWTQKEINKLKALKKEGLSYKKIASKLTRSINAIRTKSSELGLTQSVNYYSDEEIRDLKQMVYDGLSDREIANKLNRSVNSISSKRKKLGIKKEAGILNKKDVKKLKSMLDEGYDISEIANELNKNFFSVSNKAKELNFKVNKKENEDYKVVKNCLIVLKLIDSEKNINRKDLAEICDVCPRTISRYLKILNDIGYNIEYNWNYGCYELDYEDSKLDFLDVVF
jgi:transposase